MQVVSRHESRYIDDIPWSLQTSFYPMNFVTKGATRLLMAEDIGEGTVRYLAASIGLMQVGYRDWITLRAPDGNEQAFSGWQTMPSCSRFSAPGSTRQGRRCA